MMELVKLWIMIIMILEIVQTVPISVEVFFPDIGTNFAKVTWAHGVNTRKMLEETLKNPTIMMIEADVSFGTLTGSSRRLPILANLSSRYWDLSLEQFMTTIDKHNNVAGTNNRKGVKLDFQSTSSFEKSLEIIKTYAVQNRFPFWIHADIIQGFKDFEGIDPINYIDKSILFPNIVHSLGWTTPIDYGNPPPSNYYNGFQIKKMYNNIKAFKFNREVITFCVRAGLAANIESTMAITELLKWVPGSTLTIWSMENDLVSIDGLNRLINLTGTQRIYLDVPEDLRRQLVINSCGKSNIVVGVILFTVILLFWLY